MEVLTGKILLRKRVIYLDLSCQLPVILSIIITQILILIKKDCCEFQFEIPFVTKIMEQLTKQGSGEPNADGKPGESNNEVVENQLKELLSHSCFDIDVVEVDVRDNTALIFIDGNDAALLIGKEGYRYNALSYMLFNWLHTKYELFIKLEIAEFLTTQQEMIRNYIKPVIENVEKNGKGKTRFLDGILVQIALEQLRERFPDKYVAVKTAREGKKFVVINEFNNNKTHA